jgi:pimeloyl-ACP methyl ester carboxylesterase
LAFPWRAGLSELGFFQLPLFPERRIMAEDGAYVERLLRDRGAAGTQWLSAEDARHYRDALMLWPSPHCALEYQRNFVRDQVRSAGRGYRNALRRPLTAPLLSIHGQRDRLLPVSSVTAAERYVAGRHDLVSLPGVGHQPHEEAPQACTAALIGWLATVV